MTRYTITVDDEDARTIDSQLAQRHTLVIGDYAQWAEIIEVRKAGTTSRKSTWRSSRGAEAYRQAYQHITEGNPGMPAGQRRRLALYYLRITASPPLGWKQTLTAWRQAWMGPDG